MQNKLLLTTMFSPADVNGRNTVARSTDIRSMKYTVHRGAFIHGVVWNIKAFEATFFKYSMENRENEITNLNITSIESKLIVKEDPISIFKNSF